MSQSNKPLSQLIAPIRRYFASGEINSTVADAPAVLNKLRAKYADAAIHHNYLRPLAGHREVITVVLNQADRLTAPQLDQCLAHLRRLLDDDGLTGVQPVRVNFK